MHPPPIPLFMQPSTILRSDYIPDTVGVRDESGTIKLFKTISNRCYVQGLVPLRKSQKNEMGMFGTVELFLIRCHLSRGKKLLRV